LAVRLRLRRIGKKKMPMYQIVAADSRTARNGRFIEVVGRYEPRREPAVIVSKEIRVFHWLKNGARPTDTVRSLFQRSGLWLKWDLTRRGKDAATIATAMEKWQLDQVDRARRDAERKARRVAARKKAAKSGAQESQPAAAPETGVAPA
jgi:small subunit ribosomal protein S16